MDDAADGVIAADADVGGPVAAATGVVGQLERLAADGGPRGLGTRAAGSTR
jgi:hypothetical protein